MIAIILVSHASFAEGLKQAAEMIVGPQEALVAIGMAPDANLDLLEAEITTRVRDYQKSGEVLILADLAGGSPANSCARLALEGVPVVCGVNLLMLLEALLQRELLDARKLSEEILHTGVEAIVHLTRQLEDAVVAQADEKGNE